MPNTFKFEGYNLGAWVSSQRSRKEKTSTERIKLLESLPEWTWEVRNNLIAELWEKGYDSLKKYAKENGHSKVPDGLKYEGYNLGSWVGSQRRKKANLDPKKIKLLNALPKWSWKPLVDLWQEGLAHLKKYVKEYGHANVPLRFKFEKYNLGKWVAHQRSGKKKLSKERIKLLESLPGWCWVVKG